MAIKHFCDICEREIMLPEKDKNILEIKDMQNKFVTLPKEICVFCKEKIIAYYQELKSKEVENG